MAYIIKKEKEIIRQEGDDTEVTFIVPSKTNVTDFESLPAEGETGVIYVLNNSDIYKWDDGYVLLSSMPGVLDLDEFNPNEIIFLIRKAKTEKNIIIKGAGDFVCVKKLTDGGVSRDGQTITATLTSSNTKGNPGSHVWELELRNAIPKVLTIGRGVFTFKRDYNG